MKVPTTARVTRATALKQKKMENKLFFYFRFAALRCKLTAQTFQ